MTKFAQASETTPSHISNIEAGRRQASDALIVRMAQTLGVPTAALITNYKPEQVA